MNLQKISTDQSFTIKLSNMVAMDQEAVENFVKVESIKSLEEADVWEIVDIMIRHNGSPQTCQIMNKYWNIMTKILYILIEN